MANLGSDETPETPEDDPPELLTAGQLAKRARVSPSSVKRARKAGRIVPVREEDGETLYGLDAVAALSESSPNDVTDSSAQLVEASSRAMREAAQQTARAESDVRSMVLLLREGSRELLEQTRSSYVAVEAACTALRAENRALLDQMRDDRIEAFAQQKLEEIAEHKRKKVDQAFSVLRNVAPAVAIGAAKKWPEFGQAAMALAQAFAAPTSTDANRRQNDGAPETPRNPLADLGHVLVGELSNMTDEQFAALQTSISPETFEMLQGFRAQIRAAS